MLLQAAPLWWPVLAAFGTAASGGGWFTQGIYLVPFAVGWGDLCLGGWRRFLVTFVVMVVLLLGPWTVLVISLARSSDPLAGEGAAILGMLLLGVDVLIVGVVDMVQIVDVWRLAWR
jgi:hypothetical protein